MDEKVKKSLSDLIDETLMELEELKKSRFDASEVELKGPGEGIAGKPSNGKLDASKADDEDEDDKDEEKEEKEEAEKAEMDKGEGQNRQADPDGGKHKAPVEGDKHGQGPGSSPQDHKHVGNGKNNEADPDGGAHRMDKAEEAAKAEKEEKDKKDKKEKDKKDMDKNDSKSGMPEDTAAKSIEEQTSLMKSMIDDRVKPLEDKLGTILELVNKIADQPVAPKGITSKAVPLFKSADEGVEKLSKSEVSNKLFDLKKSGTKVESLDVTRAELGQDLDFIVKKYNLSK